MIINIIIFLITKYNDNYKIIEKNKQLKINFNHYLFF